MKFLNKQINRETVTDKAASGIAKGILKTQSGFEKYMLSLSKNWKGKQQWIFLYLVCLIFGGLSIIAIVNPFRVKDTNSSVIPKSIAVPKNIQQQYKSFAITENELKQVQEYKAKHPSLQQERPGLFDSLSMIEEVYYSQKK
ncbi:hypothetical protein QWZ08_00745 [Ferruginibacter paludis]|uniref:hypothetical protein n=1 Tax=Ferruginibacter paludis TaxID=1310417 RepID=UPI0025B34881|nr:hypothetical protein [Ferruginibacter paludis]MDN3654130.1 hypothetical protein [Ferruginibacter paludis]